MLGLDLVLFLHLVRISKKLLRIRPPLYIGWELGVGREDGVRHQQLLGRPAEEEGCYHHEDQFENLL